MPRIYAKSTDGRVCLVEIEEQTRTVRQKGWEGEDTGAGHSTKTIIITWLHPENPLPMESGSEIEENGQVGYKGDRSGLIVWPMEDDDLP